MFAKKTLFAIALAVSMVCSASAFTQRGAFASNMMVAKGKAGNKAAVAPK
jgi:hypothetical protein